METFHLRVFQVQVLDQCKFLLRSAVEINNGIAAEDVEQIIYGIQNLLNAGANISKMLWGQKARFAAQRERLRASMGIEENLPLRNVNMRNNFEHMDERIDRWWTESERHNCADKIIGPKVRSLVGLEPADIFRMFDPQTADVIFWGEEFNILEIAIEVQRIVPLLQEEVNKPYWGDPGRA